MRILRVRVPEFGPLRGLRIDFDPALNVVYGPNEAGKTTLLDFLLAHLFRREGRTGTRLETVMTGLDRFGDPQETPGGSIELELGGEVLGYPGGPSLLDRLGLEHAGLAGLFCVRSGELELPEKTRGEFWEKLKQVLSGFPRGLDELRKRVHEEARLTPTGDRSDEGDPGPKTRHARLTDRVEKLERLEGRLDEAARYEEEITRLERRLERLDRARRERIRQLWERLDETREELSSLPEFPEGELERWRDLREERARLRADVEEREAALREHRERAERRKERAAEIREKAEELARRLDAAERGGLEERARALAAELRGRRWPRWLADAAYWTGFGLVGAAVGVTFFTPSEALARWGLILVLLGAIGLGAVLGLWGRAERGRRERREREERELRERAAGSGLDFTDLSEIPGAVRALGDRLAEFRAELRGAEERAEASRERVAEEERALAEVRGRLSALRETIEALDRELPAGEIESAEELLERRRELRGREEKLVARLEGIAGPEEESWKPSGEEGPAAPGELPEWDPVEKERTEERLRSVRAEYRELRDEFVEAGCPVPEDVLPELAECRTEIGRLERDWRAGRIAGEIFAGMDRALEDRLSEALREDGDLSVGGLVRRITGRYEAVRREEEDGLAVRDAEGRTYSLHALSRGARDQVYLAVRLGLADAALRAAELEGGGFFLLDDAFLTADWERRERLVDVAASLAELGWQIIYLTCDDHLRDLFGEAGGELHEL